MHRFKAKVTSKGQMTLPAGFRRLTGVDAGDTVDLVVDEDGRTMLKKRRSINELVGSMNHLAQQLGRPGTKEDVATAIDEAMREQEERVLKRDLR